MQNEYAQQPYNEGYAPMGQKDLLGSAIQIAPEYGGFWIRVLATIIDGIILYAAATACILPFYMLDVASLYFITYILYPLYFLYNPVMESSTYQATFGKRAVGLIVTDGAFEKISFTKAFGRNLAKLISALVLYIGYIMVAFTEKKQGLHDMMVNTLVIKKI